MNLQQLEFFVLLAQTEHMTKAAQQLNTSQPNLSYAISELEKELNVPLFKKTGRNIRLTKYGEIFYSHITQALQKVELAKRALQEEVHPSTGKVHFGFIYTMGSKIAPLLTQQFLQLKENQQVQFEFIQGNSKELLEQLTDETIDIALVSQLSNFSHITFEPLLEQELVIVVPEKHPLAKKNQISLEETIEFPYVYFTQASGLRPYLDRLFSDYQLHPTIAVEIEEDHAILGFVSAGYGISIMPKLPSLQSYPVKSIPITNKRQPRWIYLATRKDSYLSPTVQRFKEFCQSYFS